VAEPIISISGLRGIIGETLDPTVAIRYACSFAAEIPPGPIAIGRDGRTTGPMLTDAIRAGLCAAGRDVLDADVVSTPTLGVLVREHQCAGGIQISASHNPPAYNGMKLFSGEGQVINAAAGQPVLDRYRRGQLEWATHDQLGHCQMIDDTLSRHQHLVLATVDVARIRAAKFKVLLDSNHGAGGLLGRRLLEELGCQITALGAEPTGLFAHPAEPTAENLASVLAEVTRSGAAIGFCQDPDADRLALIDEQGKYIGEEYTVALCTDHVLSKHPGPMVTNCSTSRMSEDLAAKHGVPFYRSAVGEANVTEVMRSHQATFGGEGNGGPIDPRVGYVRDSFVGMALLLDAMAASGKPVSQLAAKLPRYEIEKTKVTLDPAQVQPAFAALKAHFADATPDEMDGLRLDWSDRWLLVRSSNTEPIVRVIAESHSAAESERLCAEATEVLGKL